MDYSKLSDAEINLAVAAIQFPQSEINTPYYHRPDAYIYHRNGTHEAKDFCNNPADAWPIIENSGISLVYDGDDWLALHFSRTSLTYPNDHRKRPDKPFRAAVILWLMMQESE